MISRKRVDSAIMKVLLCIAFLLSVALAEDCTAANCLLANGCVCASTQSPINTKDTPQFVVLSIDDAVIEDNYDLYYNPLLSNRTNPDGNSISATFFVPHEYTNYTTINSLYNEGFEIAVHSISKDVSDYWTNADTPTLVAEFKGQKEILSKYANIPLEHIQGVRTPHFQLAADKSFDAYVQSGLSYDGSWTSLSSVKRFPYTLDYPSSQPCLIGACPTKAFPKFWVSPINNIKGKDDLECNALLGCQFNGTAEEIKNWLVGEFVKSYGETGNRAPFNLLLSSSWLKIYETSLKGLELFLDHLKTLKDVFIISESQLIDWMKKPTPLSQYKTVVEARKAACDTKLNCRLQKGTDIIYMGSCVPCPNTYPWVNNPEGK